MAGSTAPDGERPPGMPRWVRTTALVVAVLVAVVVLVLLISGGEHGPGRHLGQVLTW
ncbi:hypothetical protein ACFQV2_25020 [Actinokineospora soli]|uniref:Uncharacterized protein n=1 Tax=Actinokineospora soli TaxID=1048753 RepID=A0ABW2TR37_9PSEU